jgi:hypothetical protein
MTTNRPPFDTTMLAALAVLSVMFALVAFGCDQPPKSDRPEPISVTQPIGTALDDVSAIPPLARDIKADGERLRENPEDSRNVAAAAPRIVNRAEEIEDHARAAERTLTEVKATSVQNDRRVAELQGLAAKLYNENAALKQAIERERTSAMRRVQFIAGGLGTAAIIGGIVLAFSMPKSGIITVIGGVLCVSVATILPTLADWAPIIVVVSTIVAVGLIAHRNGWLDGTLRRVTQAIEQVGRANPLAGVREVKASIAVATDDAFAAIVRDETRPSGK